MRNRRKKKRRKGEEESEVNLLSTLRRRVTAATGFEASQWVGFLPRQDAARFGVRLIKQGISASRVPDPGSFSVFSHTVLHRLLRRAIFAEFFNDPGYLDTNFSCTYSCLPLAFSFLLSFYLSSNLSNSFLFSPCLSISLSLLVRIATLKSIFFLFWCRHSLITPARIDVILT